MTDQRQGVSAPAHEVLDLLDRLRPAWARHSLASLEAEFQLEAAAPTDFKRAAACAIYILERQANG